MTPKYLEVLPSDAEAKHAHGHEMFKVAEGV